MWIVNAFIYSCRDMSLQLSGYDSIVDVSRRSCLRKHDDLEALGEGRERVLWQADYSNPHLICERRIQVRAWFWPVWPSKQDCRTECCRSSTERRTLSTSCATLLLSEVRVPSQGLLFSYIACFWSRNISPYMFTEQNNSRFFAAFKRIVSLEMLPTLCWYFPWFRC